MAPISTILETASGNEAEDTARLWELCYDQAFLDRKPDIRLGQQSIDNEFIVSRYSGLFVNTMAGRPLVPSDDLCGGGPACPRSSLGVRLRAKPTNSTTLLAGLFDDTPGGGAFNDDAQEPDRSGTRVNLTTGVLFIVALQCATKIGGRAGTSKIGGWYDTGFFPDQRFASNGLSLANPDSNGHPLMHHGNYNLYTVADQTVWQCKADRSQTLNVFGRMMSAPDDRNLIDFVFNGGVTVTAPRHGRNDDQAGIALGIGRMSGQAAGFDRDSGVPARTTEELTKLTDQAQLTGRLTVQPVPQRHGRAGCSPELRSLSPGGPSCAGSSC